MKTIEPNPIESPFILGTANLTCNYGAIRETILASSDFCSILESNEICGVDSATSYGNMESLRFLVKDFHELVHIKVHLDQDLILDSNVKNIMQKHRVVLMIHNWDLLSMKEKHTQISFLRELKKQGSIFGYGASTYDNESLGDYFDFTEVFNVQVPISVINQQNIDWLEHLKSTHPNSIIIARSIFLQGLCIEVPRTHKFRNHRDLLELYSVCLDLQTSPLKMCLDFLKNLKFISQIVIGVASYSEFRQILLEWRTSSKFEYANFDWQKLSSSDQNLIDPRTW